MLSGQCINVFGHVNCTHSHPTLSIIMVTAPPVWPAYQCLEVFTGVVGGDQPGEQLNLIELLLRSHNGDIKVNTD